jgi:hypothetical protein
MINKALVSLKKKLKKLVKHKRHRKTQKHESISGFRCKKKPGYIPLQKKTSETNQE